MTNLMFAAAVVATAVAPEKVTISGHRNAKAGDTIRLSCVSAISNPPSVLTWFTRGRHIPGSTNTVMPSAQVADVFTLPTSSYSTLTFCSRVFLV